MDIKDHPSKGLLGQIETLRENYVSSMKEVNERIDKLEKVELLTSKALLIALKQQQAAMSILEDILKRLAEAQKSE